MNSKKTFLLSVVTSAVIVTAITSISQTKTSQAAVVEATVTDVVTQAPSEEMAEETQQRVIPLPYMEKSKSTYALNEPAIQFDYDPNFFVTELFEPSAETENPALEGRSPLVKSVNLWLKDDYLTLKNAGDELGDFPNRLRLSVYENPEGLPVEDWITTRASSIFQSEIESFADLDITAAGQDAWEFRYTSLFSYTNVAFRNSDGRIVVVALGLDQSPRELKDAHYGTARTAMLESLAMTTFVTTEGSE